jgi:hypothetical protein
MGLFRKKPDPISERAKALNSQIAALEAEIKRLADQPAPDPIPAAETFSRRSPFDSAAPTPDSPAVAVADSARRPRLRSTAVPNRQAQVVAATPQEPIFEDVDQNRIKADSEPVTPAHFNELGVRKYDLASAWQRIRTHFRGPVASNPKLVHYLSAGSIQGLRPLRYEKRVARNRFIFFAAALALVLWGLIAIILSRK